MVKVKESGNEEDWRAKLMDKLDCVGSVLRLFKYLIVTICLFEFFNMLLYCTRSV